MSLCQRSRWTVQPLHRCHLYYLRDCDTSVPRGMGTKEESCHTPPHSRPPISLSGQHLPRLWPSWRPRSLEILSFSLRTLGERKDWGGGCCCKSDSCRPSGEKSAWPVVVSLERIGGVDRVSGVLRCFMCMYVCMLVPQIYAFPLVDWLISLGCICVLC